MSTQSIELSGIVRNLPDNRVPDGAMQELINLRPKDGALRPVGTKVREQSVPTDVRFIHTINDNYKAVIGVSGGFLAYWLYLNGTFNKTVTTTIAIGTDIVKFATTSNSIIMANNTSKLTTVLIFDLITLTYNAIESLPELPDIQVTLATYGSESSEQYPIGTGASTFLAEGIRLVAKYSAYVLSGPVLLRFAWELTDGTTVKHSAPIYTTTSYLDWIEINNLRWNGNNIVLGTTMTAQARQIIADKYKGIIKSFNIYISRPQPLTENLVSPYVPVFAEPSVVDEVNYYLMSKISLKDLPNKLTGSILGGVGVPGPFTAVETNETLAIDNFSHHRIHGSRLFAYNNRIFLGDVTTKLYKGYAPLSMVSKVSGGQDGAAYDIGFEIDLNTSDGKKTVWSGWESCTYYDFAGALPAFDIVKYFTYPDSRAGMLRVFVRSSNIIRKVIEAPLLSVLLSNFSYKAHGSSPDFIGPLSNHPITALTTLDDSYPDQNRIQACELSNPLTFPADNSYRIGNGQILGMSTNTIALSQGQFGQFPIYCFSSDGIWAMNIGDGEVLITSIKPLSREVCNNPDSITQIDGGTVFSTSKGLMIISGVNPVEISEPAEGNHLSRISGTLNYEAIANNPNLYQIKDFLCTANILSYMAGAKIAYDHINKELVISNSAYKYSWVFSLTFKVWFKIGQVFSHFVTDFPLTYGYLTVSGTYYRYTISEEDYNDLIPVHMETRPIKFSQGTYKKINRMLVQGMINDNQEFPFSVNLFGSPDKINWYLMNASNTFLSRKPLLIGRSTFSCQYYILVIGGKVDEDAFFSSIDADYEERYGDKLR